jgi:hypothetical protein
MTVMTYDKLAYFTRLKDAGFDESQARAMAEGLDQALREEVATKADLKQLEGKMDSGFRLHNWMLGINLTLSLLILGKLVFIH